MPTTVEEYFGDGNQLLSEFRFSFLPQEILFRGIVIFVVGALLIPVALNLLEKLLHRSKRLYFIESYLISTTRVGLWFLLMLIVADSLGIPVTSIFALMGVAGLAISLALQNTLSNLAGGLQVLLSKPFEVGDYIDTDQGSGTVTALGVAYSKLTTIDNKEVMIPNHLIASSKIINHTGSGIRRVDLEFRASYQASTEKVRQALLDMCKSVPQIHYDPAPVVYLTGYHESHISYSLRVWTASTDYWEVYFYLLEEGRNSFMKHKIEIPYPQLRVQFQENQLVSLDKVKKPEDPSSDFF